MAANILIPATATALGLSAVLFGAAQLQPTIRAADTPPQQHTLPWGTGSWTQDDSPCQFSYPRFHAYFTLPATALLYLLNRPFLTQLDRAKLILLPCIAFIWTTPWDNELVRQRAWRYPRSCVLATVGYVPIEEYFFFIIQSVMSTLLAIFTTRWLLPTSYAFRKTHSRSVVSAASISVSLCIAAFVTGIALTRPQQHTYYMGMIFWWAAIPLCLLFWGTASFLTRMPWKGGRGVFVFTLVLPTVYLWACDLFALRKGTWHINEATSLNIFPIPDLPIEEMVFFCATNLLLVIASYTFDRCIVLARLDIGVSKRPSGDVASPPPYSPSYLPLNLQTIKALWGTFIVQDPAPLDGGDSANDAMYTASIPQNQVNDLQMSLRILSRASRSFSTAALLFPWDLRSDLSILYGFCRAADDFVDEAVAAGGIRRDTKSSRLALLHKVVDAIYSHEEDTNAARSAIRHVLRVDQDNNSTTSVSVLEEIRASASGVVSLRHLVPRCLWLELLRGYNTDLQFDLRGSQARFETMDELVEYAQCVAGCVGEMCVRVVLGRTGHCLPLANTTDAEDIETSVDRKIPLSRRANGTWVPVEVDDGGSVKPAARSSPTPSTPAAPDNIPHLLLYNARRMGVALQLVNIARDVVEDSTKLNRCYLPVQLLDTSQEDGDGNARAMAEDTVSALFAGRLDFPNDEKATRTATTPETLRPHILTLLALSATLYHASLPSLTYFSPISKPVESGLRAACEVYFAIGDSILHQSQEQVKMGHRATMTTAKRAWRAIRSVYGF